MSEPITLHIRGNPLAAEIVAVLAMLAAYHKPADSKGARSTSDRALPRWPSALRVAPDYRAPLAWDSQASPIGSGCADRPGTVAELSYAVSYVTRNDSCLSSWVRSHR
jgi:hypothetical protein